ncbi:MAG: homoserine dehydrogenase [Acidimicrobiales bacterium]|nr:homoserine dehydrogenase [Acidimicrobiales bacterium]|tara:strand:- start:478 stop:1812 length:1335 start_codon:yes stop_codon:yes gene_type:complete
MNDLSQGSPPSPGSGTHVRVGLLGCGHVGAALAVLVAERRAEVGRRRGLDLEVTRIAVRNTAIDRDVPVADGAFTTDAAAVVCDPDVDVVVEVMGGVEPARELVSAALSAGKPVVTANKELLANHGAELYALAAASGVDLLFEAAVAGAIPIMRPLRESLAGEPIKRVMGIVNGTTNFILTRMTDDGASYADALAEAQSLGYAERDPTADVEGYDAGAKAAIMATIAFGARVVAGDVYHEGISGISVADIEFAADLKHCIKLLAVAEQTVADDGEAQIGVRVHPTLVPLDHPLASVNGSFNAVFLEGGAAGDLMLYGRGAGGRPTASAVLGDLIDAATNLRQGTASGIGVLERARIAPIDDVISAYYLNIEVDDRPGVLAAVAAVFGSHEVSIRSMEQEGMGGEARLVFITHGARERDLRATLADLRSLEAVRAVGSVLRVIGD